MSNLIAKTIGTAAAAAVASTILGVTPASAATPGPTYLATLGEVGTIASLESVDMNGYVLLAGGPGGGTELYRTNGNLGSVAAVKDINPGNAGSAPRLLTRAGSTAFFVATTAAHGRELWRSNGTAAGTTEVEDLVAGAAGAEIDAIAALGNQVVFSANVQATGGDEPHISDGTADGTQQLKDINPSGSSTPRGFTTIGGLTFFSADDGTHGRELWRTDGTPEGTIMVEDTNPGASGSSPSELTVAGNVLYFDAVTANGSEPFRSTGSAASTYQLKDIFAGGGSSQASGFTQAGGITYFSARSEAGGFELWRTDGTPAGTSLVEDILPGAGSSTPNEITALGSKVIFRAGETDDNTELWTSDGTAAGTVQLKDVRPGALGGSPQRFVVNGGRAVFSANDGVSGQELWVTDGTIGGTAEVKDIVAGSASSTPTPVGTVAGVVVFRVFFNETSSLWSVAPSTLDVVTSSTPDINGERRVAKTLKADAGAWEAGATLSYQWLRDGSPIDGATASSYKLTTSNVGKKVSVRVSGAKNGKVTGVRVSSASTIKAGIQVHRPTPSIVGTAKVGNTLKIKARTYDSGVSKSYQWLRDGKAISGSSAQKSSYKVRSADKSHRISVKVTATKTAYESFTRTSAKTSKVS